MTRAALPKHPKKKRGKEGRVYKGKNELQHVHNVIEATCGIRSHYGKRNTKDSRHAAHPQVMLVASRAIDIGLVDIPGPDSVERRHIACHSGHEAGQQRRQPKTKDTRRKIPK
jgi:hypothetical protein